VIQLRIAPRPERLLRIEVTDMWSPAPTWMGGAVSDPLGRSRLGRRRSPEARRY